MTPGPFRLSATIVVTYRRSDGSEEATHTFRLAETPVSTSELNTKLLDLRAIANIHDVLAAPVRHD